MLGKIQKKMICDIPVLFGNTKFVASYIYRSYTTTQFAILELLTFLCQPMNKVLASKCNQESQFWSDQITDSEKNQENI